MHPAVSREPQAASREPRAASHRRTDMARKRSEMRFHSDILPVFTVPRTLRGLELHQVCFRSEHVLLKQSDGLVERDRVVVVHVHWEDED